MGSVSDIFHPDSSVYLVGIKGTGVCALAELLKGLGVKVSGSDIDEVFYTDAILKELDIPYYESFNPAHITDDIDTVIHSAAYSPENNVELETAINKSIPLVSYPKALGAYSALFDSTGIAGVHGKTTTAAMSGCLMSGLGIPAQILVGSAVAQFKGKSTLILGNKFFIAETCEYRKHFLEFRPKHIVLTAVESDHQDFFPTYESIRDAFVEYCRLIPVGGDIIYCADDSGASEVAGIIEKEGRGVNLIPYGFSASGKYKILSYRVEGERALFAINAFPEGFFLRIPGRHQALNATAAVALAGVLAKKDGVDANNINNEYYHKIKKTLEEFLGSKRRSEVIGESGGILFMDDYGHHPAEIKTTLEGLRAFYPSRRLVVSFMSHTYTRTAALLDEFASSLNIADVLFLHKIFASAREKFNGKIEGKNIYEKIKNLRNNTSEIFYIDEFINAFEPLKEKLKPGDLFLTLGAGNNWPLAFKLYEYFRGGKAV